jgi:hypothetical protein
MVMSGERSRIDTKTSQSHDTPRLKYCISQPRWVKLDNLFKKHKVRRHTEHVTLLYMLAELNGANLIKVHLSVISCLGLEDERYGYAFFAADATGSQEAMEACIKGLEMCQSVGGCTGKWPE